jgi:hypothetical protein
VTQLSTKRNAVARSLYLFVSHLKDARVTRRSPSVKRNPFTLPVKADRRMPDVRRRLPRLSKPEIIEQLLESQNARASSPKNCAENNQ